MMYINQYKKPSWFVQVEKLAENERKNSAANIGTSTGTGTGGNNNQNKDDMDCRTQ